MEIEKSALKDGETGIGTPASPAGNELPAKGISEAPAGAQPPKKDAGDILEETKAKLARLEEEKAKLQEERDNYRAGLLAAKAKRTVLSPELEAPAPPPPPAYPYPYPPVKPAEPEFGEEGEYSQKKVAEIAEQKARQIFDARDRQTILQNEQIAIKKWLQKHPELVDDALREAVTAEYSAKHGRSVDGILYDLDRAYTFFKIDRGYDAAGERRVDSQKTGESALASVPTGAGKSESTLPGFNDFESAVMRDYDIPPEQFKAWKAKVKAGEMEVPVHIYDKLFNA